MRVAMMTREYPPEVYGGAGVHVTELTRYLRELCDVDVYCMGADRTEAGVQAFNAEPALDDANPAIKTLSAGLRMAASASQTDLNVVHSHTWYAGLGGHLTGLLAGVPHVVTAHSLEPHRPWKREQLQGGYDVSSWSEQNAMEKADGVIAVSARMKDAILDAYPNIDPDKIHIVLNGIDTELWQPRPTFDEAENSLLKDLGVRSDRPIAAFVGRITRQKGVAHLVRAAKHFDPEIQLVLCAGAPDTPEIAAEIEGLVNDLKEGRDGVFWVKDMVSKPQLQEVLSAADVFVCPSIYEPLGIVNLEAMACNTAVVASDVGGIPEVVVDGDTGYLAHYDENATDDFEHEIAAKVNQVCADKQLAEKFGVAGRNRAVNDFSWATIAEQTLEVYKKLQK